MFSGAQAATSPQVIVKGVLMSFDEKIIRIKTAPDAVVSVPRDSVENLDGYIAGKAKIAVKVHVTDLLSLNK